MCEQGTTCVTVTKLLRLRAGPHLSFEKRAEQEDTWGGQGRKLGTLCVD